ncbi:MAG TPA: diguanylate cyclase [Gemmatimonadales bacterium]|nr:diguanylate cyclase [Gemmatimonadales bacterium]
MPTQRLSSGSRRRLTPVAPWPAAGSVEEHVRAETVRAVFQQALLAPILTLLVGGLVGASLWRASLHGPLLLWLGAVAVLSVARLTLLLAYRRRSPPPDRMIGWERAFVFTLVLVSLAWGVGAALVLPSESLAHEAIVYFFLIGIAGGAVASYSVHPRAVLLCLLSLMVPVTIQFALANSIELRAMAAAGVMYLIASLRATRNYGAFWQRTFQLSWELQQAHTLAQKLSRTDDLTGLNNRRAFTELAKRALEQARRYGRPLALVMFDIDHFKHVNDTYGHAAGDRVLQALAQAIRGAARDPDIAGRLGGEEFALLLPETSGPEAVTLAERLRRVVGGIGVPHDGATISFTCSFGVAARQEDVAVLDTLLNRADEALYRAKRQGRDRISLDVSAGAG